jgi:hypothetical protein
MIYSKIISILRIVRKRSVKEFYKEINNLISFNIKIENYNNYYII